MNTFQAALNGDPHDSTPVWFMRQAGRYLPGYTGMRKSYSIKEICMDRDLTLEVTKEPLDTIGVDAAIIFSDITTPLEAMGFKVEFREGIGPVIGKSLLDNPALSGIRDFSTSGYHYATYDSIKRFTETVTGFPIIGFSGGPLTLASYVVAGRADKELQKTKKKMFTEDPGFSQLMEMITEMVIAHCREQIRNGASAIQIFDSWAGFLSPEWFRKYSEKYLKQIQAELSGFVPIIYFSTQTTSMPDLMAGLGFDFLSIDWRTDIRRFSEFVGEGVGLQGNLDPALAASSKESAVKEARSIVESMADKDRYIFNLGHGVLPDTQPETLREIVKTVHEFRRER